MTAAATQDLSKDSIGIIDYFGRYLGKGIRVAIVIGAPWWRAPLLLRRSRFLESEEAASGKEVKVASGYHESNPMLAAKQAEQKWERE